MSKYTPETEEVPALLAEFPPLYAGTMDKWLKKETWMTGLHHSLADPARI